METTTTTTTTEQPKQSMFITPVSPIDLIIAIALSIVLIYTAIEGQASETIIGIFGGYFGANMKNAITKSKTDKDGNSVTETKTIFVESPTSKLIPK